MLPTQKWWLAIPFRTREETKLIHFMSRSHMNDEHSWRRQDNCEEGNISFPDARKCYLPHFLRHLPLGYFTVLFIHFSVPLLTELKLISSERLAMANDLQRQLPHGSAFTVTITALHWDVSTSRSPSLHSTSSS